MILQKIEFLDINYVTQILGNINLLDEQENIFNNQNFVPISIADKHRLYAPLEICFNHQTIR